ncbi:MAG: DUF4124 domain-containing protein [Betaproteobacteria bacterium]|nr:DUF4124 domain-containing protein [Betaproteobacteria bacterium]
MKSAHAAISSFLFFLAFCAAPAFAQVFKCVDAIGKVTYSNGSGLGKGCKQLSNEQSVSIISIRPNPSQAAFPRISDETQRERDRTRRYVLEKELDSERLGLEDARNKLAEQEAVRYGNEKNYQRMLDRLQPYREAVERRERNIEALTQELSELR